MSDQYAAALDHFETHGFATIPNFLPEEIVLALSAEIDTMRSQGEMKKAGIGREAGYLVKADERGDFIHWIDPLEASLNAKIYLETLQELITQVNRNFYLGIRDAEIHYAEYPKGTFYKRHSDKHRDGSARTVSVVFYLNEHWKEEDGGQLRIYLEDGAMHDILPCAGTLAFFLSDKEHEVLITNRSRKSITGWLLNKESFL
jgi:SM-20-related protein